MPAKNKKRPPARLAIQIAFAMHAEAKTLADEWAAKSLAYRRAGKPSQAKAAERKARHRLLKTLNLATRAARRNAPVRATRRAIRTMTV
jgi:hypothetical protein